MKTNEIKFRVWNKTKERYLPTKSWALFDISDLPSPEVQGDWRSVAYFFNDLKYKVEQFLKLKDKNGVDIYEGDIVFDEVENESQIAAFDHQPINASEFLTITGNVNQLDLNDL